eukprot:5231419-Prymnesium_polylepis.1
MAERQEGTGIVIKEIPVIKEVIKEVEKEVIKVSAPRTRPLTRAAHGHGVAWRSEEKSASPAAPPPQASRPLRSRLPTLA